MLYTFLLQGVGTPLLQEHVAGIVQDEVIENLCMIDIFLSFVLQTNSQVQPQHFSHLIKWKRGVTHKWLGFIQFGLVLFGLGLILGNGEKGKGEIKMLNKDKKVIGRV